MIEEALINYYELLQVPQTADAAEIKAAISAKRRVWIKRQASADAARRAEAEETVRRLDEAEGTLLDATRRREYDQRLAQQPTAAATSTAADGSGDWLDRARAYLEMGNPTAAHRAACEATTQRGSDHAAWAMRAHSSFLLGNPADAEFEFAEAIRLQPGQVEYHQDLGEVYGMQEKWQQALREFNTALQLSPGNPVARTSITQVYLSTHEARKALELMEAVVRENPDNEVFKYYLAAALDGAARESLTLLRDDSILATSAAQVVLLEEHADRMAALNLKDPEVRDSIADLRRLASAAQEMMWIHSSNWQAYAIALGVLVCGLFGGLGSSNGGAVALSLLVFAPLTGAVIYAYVMRHRKPTWEHAARVFQGDIVRRGI
jgi:tetratricopeptide (TPR) repeat protein